MSNHAATLPSEECSTDPPDKIAESPDSCTVDADAGHMPEASIVELDRCRSVITCQKEPAFPRWYSASVLSGECSSHACVHTCPHCMQSTMQYARNPVPNLADGAVGGVLPCRRVQQICQNRVALECGLHLRMQVKVY
jgi:hypothetical protein